MIDVARIRASMQAFAESRSHDVDDLEERLAAAAGIIARYGDYEGEHHKMWVLDQALRALTGCPWETMTLEGGRTYQAQGESEVYRELISADDFCDWEEGVAP